MEREAIEVCSLEETAKRRFSLVLMMFIDDRAGLIPLFSVAELRLYPVYAHTENYMIERFSLNTTRRYGVCSTVHRGGERT